MQQSMKEPVFKKVLSDNWMNLGEVVRKHYFLTPFSDDYVCVKGKMEEVFHSKVAKLFLPFGLLFGAYSGPQNPDNSLS